MTEERYRRNLGALDETECARLREAAVFVAGCGGLGGYVLECLARIGVGRLKFCDGDVFDAGNLNRQLLCEEQSIGKSKAMAAKARLSRINSSIAAEAADAFLTRDNACSLLEGCQIAVDALDNIPSRRILADACARHGIPLVHAAVSGWRAQVTVIPPGGRAFDFLYPEGAVAPETGIAAFTPALAASIQAAETVKALLGREPGLSGKLLLIDLAANSCDIVALS